MKLKELKNRILAKNQSIELKVKQDLAHAVALQIEEARLRKGLTQKQLASKIKTQQSNIARIENGRSLPSLSMLNKIAKAFDSYLIPPRFAFLAKEESSQITSLASKGGIETLTSPLISDYCEVNNGVVINKTSKTGVYSS